MIMPSTCNSTSADIPSVYTQEWRGSTNKNCMVHSKSNSGTNAALNHPLCSHVRCAFTR